MPSKHIFFFFASIVTFCASAQDTFLRTYDQLTTNTSLAYSIKATPDDGFVIIGSTNGGEDADIFMVKSNARGGALWAKQCGGAMGSEDIALDITPTRDGGYIFCGNSDESRILWKTDSIGNDLWKAPFGASGKAAFAAVTEIQSGDIIAVGDGMVITKANANGDELWTRNKPTQRRSAYRAIHELPNGDLLVGGFFTARDQGRMLSILVKMDADGKAYWAETYGPGVISSITSDEAGNIWVAGNAQHAVPLVLKINTEGKAVWEGVYDEQGLGGAHSISVDEHGSATVMTTGGFFRTDNDGAITEQQTTPHFGFNKGLVMPDGKLVLAGFCDASINGYEKFTFMKMDASGFPAPTASTE